MSERDFSDFGFGFSLEALVSSWANLKSRLPEKTPYCPMTADLVEFAEGKLASVDEGKYRQHIEQCPYCRPRFLAQQEAVHSPLMDQFLGHTHIVPVPAPSNSNPALHAPSHSTVLAVHGAAADNGNFIVLEQTVSVGDWRPDAQEPVILFLKWVRPKENRLPDQQQFPWQVTLSMPSKAANCEQSNSEVVMRYFRGRRVRCTFIMSVANKRWYPLETRLDPDPSRKQLVSHPEPVLIEDPNAITHLEFFPLESQNDNEGLEASQSLRDVTKLDTQTWLNKRRHTAMVGKRPYMSKRGYLVSFPALKSPIPGSQLSDADLCQHLRDNIPHWLYHLEVVSGEDPLTSHPFEYVTPEWVKQLAACLGLADTSYSVGALEMVPGHPDLVTSDAYSFHMPLTNYHRSFSLPIALGLASAAARRPIPPWIVSTGSLSEVLEPALNLTTTNRLEEKIKLCLGRDSAYDVGHIVDRFHRYPNMTKIHGPLEMRTISGKVKVFIIPTAVDDWGSELRERLGIEYTDKSLELPSASLADWKRRIDELTPAGSMLIVQVRNVWQALRLLGFHHHHSGLKRMMDEWDRSCERPYVFRVYPEGKAKRSFIMGDTLYQKRKLQELLTELERQLENEPGHNRRLGIILDKCVNVLDGDGGIVRRLDANSTWLEYVTCTGRKELESLLWSVPVGEGITGPVIRDGEIQVAECRAQAMRIHKTSPADEHLEDRYQPSACEKHRRFVESLPAVVCMPLKANNHILGLACLHMKREGPVDADSLYWAEGLAKRAALELLQYNAAENVAKDAMDKVAQLVKNLKSKVAQLVKDLGSVALVEALDELGNSLTAEALKLTGAYRAVLRVISHGGNSLAVTGVAGGNDVWPSDIRKRPFPRSTDSACNHVLNQDASYLITDTNRKDIHFEKIEPTGVAHLAVLVRHGNQVIGVLSLDFDAENRYNCNEKMLRLVEDLAAIYAAPIFDFSKDQLYSKLDKLLPQVSTSESLAHELSKGKFDYWLKAVGRALGVDHGSIYIRSIDTGEFELVSSLDNEASGIGTRYFPGEGRTGWVIQQKLPLRINNCENKQEIQALHPPLRPSRYQDCWDRRHENLAYLAVPVVVGDDVLAVLRFVCKSKKHDEGTDSRALKVYFSSLDQQLAEVAASRLGPWLYNHKELLQTIALRQLARKTVDSTSRYQLCETIHATMERGIGKCLCVIRMVDNVDKQGDPTPSLDRIFLSNGAPTTPVQCRAKGEGVTGWVWENKKKWVIRNAKTDERLVAIALNANEHEQAWWQNVGCGVITPMIVNKEFVGTLAMLRSDPGVLLQSDIDFVEKVTELAALAFQRLEKTQLNEIETALLRAVVNYFWDTSRDIPDAATTMLEQIGSLLLSKLNAAAGFVWSYDQVSSTFDGLWSSVTDHAALNKLERNIVARELEKGFVVVSDAHVNDDRLKPFLYALPDTLQTQYENCQRVAILLAGTQHINLIQQALFFFVVESPQRLNHKRIEHVVRMLTTTLLRHTGDAAAKADSLPVCQELPKDWSSEIPIGEC